MKSTVSIIALVACSISSPGFSQETKDNADMQSRSDLSPRQGTGLEEIVVTAQRVSERLQDVPIAVTALSANAIERRGVAGTFDLPSVVPSLQLTKSTFSVQPFIRGVGNPSIQPGSDPSVATYVDGVYQSSSNGLLFSFNNIERIEVLKGPQGTLFGRNATGGLIQIITKDPQPGFSGKLSVGYGNFNTWQTSAYISGGNDTVAGDIAVIYNNQSHGWGKNTFTPNQATESGSSTVLVGGVPVTVPDVAGPVGVTEELGIRSKLVFNFSDRLKVKVAGNYLSTDGDQGFYRHPLYGARQRIGSVGQTTPYVYTGGFYDINSNVQPYHRVWQHGGTLDIQYELDFADLRSISAYQNSHSKSFTQSSNVPYVDAGSGTSEAHIRVKSYSEELQLVSKPGSSIQWIAGAYWTSIRSGYLPLHFYRGNYLQGGTTRVASTTVRSLAGFGQASANLWEGGRLTVGARYTRDSISAEQYFFGTDTTAAPGSISAIGVLSSVVPEMRMTQKRFTWRVALDHRFARDVMGYVSVNTGYKAGGFNAGGLCLTNAVGNCPAAQIAPSYKPETLTAYEVGLKSEFLNNTVRLNLSGFYYDYKDLQVQSLIANNLGQLISRLDNAATSRNFGAEAELSVSPVRNLSFTVAASYLDAKYKKFPNASLNIPTAVNAVSGGNTTVTADASGRPLNRSPEFTISTSAQLTVPTGLGDLDLNANLYHTSSFYWETSLRLKQKPYTLVNMTASLALDRGFRVRAFARNILDEKYYSFQSTSSLGDQGAPAAPRTYGAALEWSF